MNRHRISRRLVVAFAALLVAALLVAEPLAAPSRAADDVSQPRAVGHFDRIRLEGPFSSNIVAGARATTLVVSGHPDLVARVTSKVESGTLIIGMRSGDDVIHRAPMIAIGLPVLHGFTNNGAGSTHISGLTGADIEIENAGAASIVVSGRAANESITLNGAGTIDARAVDAHNVTVDNNGVGTIDVRASRSLTLNVNGVGAIRYAGNPSHLESHVNGIGHIGRL